MKRTTLKSKMIFGCIAISIFVMALSGAVISYQLKNQNLIASLELIKRAFTIVIDELSGRQASLSAAVQQLAGMEGIAEKVKFILDYKTSSDKSFTGATYTQLAEATHGIGLTANVWKMAIYDGEGDLISFIVAEDGAISFGTAQWAPEPAFQVAGHKAGEDFSKDSWKPLHTYAEIDAVLDGKMPERKMVRFEQSGAFMCLAAYAPIIGEVYNKDSGLLEPRQVGLVKALQKLDQGFVGRMNRLTGTQMNIFTSQGLSVGDITDYKELAGKKSDQSSKSADLSPDAVGFAEVQLDNGDYFQGVLTIFTDSEYIGSIAALYSKANYRANLVNLVQMMAIVFLVCVLVIIPAAVIFSNSLAKPIMHAVRGFTDISGDLVTAAGQVSSSSSLLAEGTSEQAASLEETSASLEQMSSMTRQNADNAGQANGLMLEASDQFSRATTSMTELTQSMQEISRVSEETSKIIRTIDEIAFRTNLLALNAAVEAARAGEAGAGFAVVADEVRNLAMRTAEAARDTAQLIEGSVNKIKDGTTLVTKTHAAFSALAESSSKVADLIRGINTASSEQAYGIEQINQAVAEMDKVIQENATHAEQSAAASEALHSQAGMMREFLFNLEALVGSTNGKNGNSAGRQISAALEAPASNRSLPMDKVQIPAVNGKD